VVGATRRPSSEATASDFLICFCCQDFQSMLETVFLERFTALAVAFFGKRNTRVFKHGEKVYVIGIKVGDDYVRHPP
jgi:hypothetical protein